MEQQLSDILKNYEDLKKQVYDFITNTEHFIFYWIEEGEVKSFIKKNPDNYEELIKLSVVSISETSAWVIIRFANANNLSTRCDFGSFKEYTLYQWEKFNGQLKQHRIRQIKNEINYYRQKLAENEELLKGLTKTKFKVDDWIAYNENKSSITPTQIINITEDNKYIVSGNWSYNFRTLEADWHLWTIADAKDGDVLVLNGSSKEYKWIGIFKAHTSDTSFSSHCHYNCGMCEFVTDIARCTKHGTKYNDIRPATNEERELLFAKMKEAGYGWDSDKKELYKI